MTDQPLTLDYLDELEVYRRHRERSGNTHTAVPNGELDALLRLARQALTAQRSAALDELARLDAQEVVDDLRSLSEGTAAEPTSRPRP